MKLNKILLQNLNQVEMAKKKMYRSINMSILGIVLLTLLLSCAGSSSHSLSNELIEIDVKKEYPKKDIILNDIAEITYIPLETNDSSVIHPNFEISLSTDTIIVSDRGQSKLFLFNKKGSYLDGFKRSGGQSGEEYNSIDLFAVI